MSWYYRIKRARDQGHFGALINNILPCDPIREHYRAGSLIRVVHLSNNNARVLRPSQRGQKSHVEQKDKNWFDLDVQYVYRLLSRAYGSFWLEEFSE